MSNTEGAPAPTNSATAWHTGLAPELVGLAQNKAWKLDDPKEAFAAAATAYQGAAKFIGAPPEDILRIPKPTTTADELKAFWSRLGAVDDPKAIDLSAVKTAAGEPIDERLSEILRQAAVAARVPKDAAVEVAKAVVKHLDGAEAERKALHDSRLAEEKAALDRNWGVNKERNMFVAKEALTKLAQAANVPMDKATAAWDALSAVGGLGAAAAMQILLTAGLRMGEGKYVSQDSNPNAPMSREAALARIEELKQDTEFGKRYLNGDVRAKAELTGLHQIAFAA